MIQILIIRPGTTEYDEQGRIMGRLNIPLSRGGAVQVAQTVRELSEIPVDTIYATPSQSSLETAEAVAKANNTRVRPIESLRNLDPGLWQGKLVDELKNQQPKIYKRWQDDPESVCPPGGEMLSVARERVRKGIEKTLRKHKSGVIALVMPEPIASVVRSELTNCALGNLWKAECSEGGQWQLIEYQNTLQAG